MTNVGLLSQMSVGQIRILLVRVDVKMGNRGDRDDHFVVVRLLLVDEYLQADRSDSYAHSILAETRGVIGSGLTSQSYLEALCMDANSNVERRVFL